MTDVAFVIHSMEGGGAERVCLYLAEEFARRGHAIDLVVCRATGPHLKELSERIRVVDLDVTSSARWARRLAQYYAEVAPRHVLAFMEGAGVVSVAARALTPRARRPRIWVSSHNHFSIHVLQAPHRRERYLQSLASRLTLPRADGLIGVSQGVSRDLARFLRLPEERVHTVYNPVVTSQFEALAAEAPTHPWLAKGARDVPVLVAAGRLTPQKGFDTLLSAVARVRREREVRLVLFGEGPLRGELEAQVAAEGLSDCVSMPGFVGNPFAEFAAADLFVLSSRWEGFGLVLVEAMATGCPVVSTDCPSGPAEILQGGALGPLVPIDDPDALADAISSRLAAPRDAERLKAHGLRYTVEATADGYERVLGLRSRSSG